MTNKNIPENGMLWPEGQALPHFSKPDELDTFTIAYLSDSAKFMLTVMQGLVKRKKTRIFLNGIKTMVKEGADHWPDVLELKQKETTANMFEFIKKRRFNMEGV